MADKITTLQLKGDPSTKIYPNVKDENIPDTIVRQSALADNVTTKDIEADSGTIASLHATDFELGSYDTDKPLLYNQSSETAKMICGNGDINVANADSVTFADTNNLDFFSYLRVNSSNELTLKTDDVRLRLSARGFEFAWKKDNAFYSKFAFTYEGELAATLVVNAVCSFDFPNKSGTIALLSDLTDSSIVGAIDGSNNWKGSNSFQSGDVMIGSTKYYEDGVARYGGTLKIDFPSKEGTFALTNDIPTYYRHAIHIQIASSSTDEWITDIWLEGKAKNNLAIDSLQDLISVFGNTTLLASGAYMTYLNTAYPITALHVGTSSSDTMIGWINTPQHAYNTATLTQYSTGSMTISDSVTSV